MMYLKPDGKCDLEHRAYFVRGTTADPVLVAAEDGQLSVVGTKSKEQHLRRLPTRVRAISPHPSGQLWAWVDGDSGSLIVQRLNGERLVECLPPSVSDASQWLKPRFEDCHFDDSGEFLWLAAPRGAEEFEIQLLETKSWSLVAQATAEDPFGGSSCSFHLTGRPDLVSLWVAAGQDGQQVYWLKQIRNGFSCTLEERLRNTVPPVFSPNGQHVLVVDEHHAICQFTFPSMQTVGSPLESADEDDPFAESLCYLNDRQALASTNEQRIFLVDTVRMKVEEEVALEGHEPRPIGEYYPTLAKEAGLGTDISYFARLGEVIIFVCRRDRTTGLSGWKDSLLWVRVKGQL